MVQVAFLPFTLPLTSSHWFRQIGFLSLFKHYTQRLLYPITFMPTFFSSWDNFAYFFSIPQSIYIFLLQILRLVLQISSSPSHFTLLMKFVPFRREGHNFKINLYLSFFSSLCVLSTLRSYRYLRNLIVFGRHLL